MNHPVAGSLSLAIDERFKALLHTIQQLPPKGSRPLTVSARVSGWATSRATSALTGLPGVRIEDAARSEECRVGTECVRRCRSWCSPDHYTFSKSMNYFVLSRYSNTYIVLN